MLSKTIHVVKCNNTNLSVNHRNKHYVVGFFSYEHAKAIKNRIDVNRDMSIHRSHIVDISDDVNAGLEGFGIQKSYTDLTIDSNAKLEIPIIPLSLSGPNTDKFEIEEMATCDLIMYPFEWNLGVVLTSDLSNVFSSFNVYNAQVIDPCSNTIDMMRKMME